MLKYKKVQETKNRIIYEYYPEGGLESGIVSVDKVTGECKIEVVAANDINEIYALQLLSRLRKFVATGTFEESGLVAWY